jgi:hypothetical protein
VSKTVSLAWRRHGGLSHRALPCYCEVQGGANVHPMRAGNCCTAAVFNSPAKFHCSTIAPTSIVAAIVIREQWPLSRSRDNRRSACSSRHVTKHSWRCLKLLGWQFQLHMHGDVTARCRLAPAASPSLRTRFRDRCAGTLSCQIDIVFTVACRVNANQFS